MNTFTILDEAKSPKQSPMTSSELANLPNSRKAKHTSSKKKTKKKRKSRCGMDGDVSSMDKTVTVKTPPSPSAKKKCKTSQGETRKPKKTRKKSSTRSLPVGVSTSNKEKKKKTNKTPKSYNSGMRSKQTDPTSDDEKTFLGTSTEDCLAAASGDGSDQPKMPRRVSFGSSGIFEYRRDIQNPEDGSLTIAFGCQDKIAPKAPSTDSSRLDRSTRSLYSKAEDLPMRRISYLANSIKSYLSLGSEHHKNRNRNRSEGRRSAFAISRGSQQNQKFRISKNPTKMKTERIEAFFYNHGMEIALGVLYLALNILMAAHGAYQFTEIGGWKTEDDVLRVTLPIARAGGRLVTLNCAILLLTACKYLWTCVRTYVAPVLPIGFPIDNIMPKYHRYVALTVIVSGCIVHTLPQIVNYATKSIVMEHNGMKVWTFGDGFATKQLLLTGTLLTIIFSTFFLTTMKSFRKTAAGFRWFWFFHVGGIATAYPLLLLHGTCRGHPVFMYFALLPLALYVFDIAMRRSKVSTAEVIAWKTHEDQGQQITELVLKCPKNFEYTPGQYAELKFSPISSTEWHPFTIASAPDETSEIVFYIKNSGRWTEAMYNYASAFDLSKAKKSPTFQIRGPHGAPAMNYFEYRHIVVIGSGVGVTPLLSIWKYLVAKGRTMVCNSPVGSDKDDDDSFVSTFHESQNCGDSDSFYTFNTGMLLSSGDEDNEKPKSKLVSMCIVLEKIFESMTVSMILLVIFVLGETLTFVLQLFGQTIASNSLGSVLSVVALVVHGSTVAASGIAKGWSGYFKLFRSWLECAIILADIVALGTQLHSTTGVNRAYFISFGVVVVLHAIRIFHKFYTTLKAPTHDDTAADVDETNDSRHTLSRSISFSFRDNPMNGSRNHSPRQELCSIDGILINRTYSSMKFAARSLLRPVLHHDNGRLADVFSMACYGTREPPKANHNEKDRSQKLSELLGSDHGMLSDEGCFRPGRPNWNHVFLTALARAHKTNPTGESVGVFFCGSPAIAKDLQVSAREVTAQHQFAMKHLDGKPCKCKLIVHSENF